MIVPAALAMAERQRSSVPDLLRAVALGYDIGARTNLVLTYEALRKHLYNSHSFGGTIGAAAAAGMQLGLDAQRMRYLLSYAAQQVGGLRTWVRDPEHVEKAFAVGGMGARNGVTAALLVEDGFTGVDDVFAGKPNYFDIFVENPKRSELTDRLGKRFEVTRTNIKKWSVGSPIQAALDATHALIRKHGFKPGDIEKVVAHLPKFSAVTVDNRAVPNISVQHLIALMIVDGTVTFRSSHDFARMNDPKVAAMRGKVALKGVLALEKAKPARQAKVEIFPKAGKKVSEHVRAVRGTAANPMTRAEVEAKAYDLTAPVLGAARAKKLIAAIWSLEATEDIRALRPFLTA
jgi:2-methylcitrate dehydratase PrpD